MAHFATGNPTWEDYPNLSTLVSAAALENIELVLDNLKQPPVAEAIKTTASSGLLANTDYFHSFGWTTVTDPYGMWSNQTFTAAGASPLTATIPAGWGGRYDVEYSMIDDQTAGGQLAAKVLKNCPSNVATVTAAVLAYSVMTGMGFAANEGTRTAIHRSMEFAAGDTLTFALWSSVGPYSLPTSWAQVTSAIVVRYLGPN